MLPHQDLSAQLYHPSGSHDYAASVLIAPQKKQSDASTITNYTCPNGGRNSGNPGNVVYLSTALLYLRTTNYLPFVYMHANNSTNLALARYVLNQRPPLRCASAFLISFCTTSGSMASATPPHVLCASNDAPALASTSEMASALRQSP